MAPIFFRPAADVARRLNKVCERHHKTRIAVAEEGLLAEIERLEVRAPGVSVAEAKALAELRALNIDPLPHLEAIIKDAVESPLPVVVSAAKG